MIEIKKLVKSFKKNKILKELDLSIKKGEKIALIGSNGAGKTTLIRCILGEYTYDGEVSIDKKHPRHHRTDVLKNIGFVPQLPPPLKMPVGSLIEFSAKISQTKESHIIKIAKDLGLDVLPIKKQPFFKLSGGQKQKLLIAIALGRDCPILIMDEPAANLDPQARAVLFKILAQKPQDTIMLISSHRLDEVASLVNRVIELDQGIIILDDMVSDNVDMAQKLLCTLTFNKKTDSFAKNLIDWNLKKSQDGITFKGEIAGADRLKFLSLVSRYASSLKEIQLTEK